MSIRRQRQVCIRASIIDCRAAILARIFCDERGATVAVQNQFTSRFPVFGIKYYFARFEVLSKTLKTLDMHSIATSLKVSKTTLLCMCKVLSVLVSTLNLAK